MSQIYIKLAALLLLLVMGRLMQRRLLLPEAFYDNANTLLVRVTLPAMILASMDKTCSREVMQNSAILLLVVCGTFTAIIACLEIWRRCSRLSGEKLGVYQYLILVGNTAFMGYPVIQAVYGDEGVFYASICNLVHNLITLSYAVGLLQRGVAGARKHRSCSACLLASIVGVILFLSPFRLPECVHQALDWTGSITIPLCLLCIGARLSVDAVQRSMRSAAVWAISLTRLVAFPVLLAPILYMFNCNGVTLVVPVVMFATPAALTASAFAQQYGCDAEFAANTVILSNVLSLFTLPAVIACLY